MDLVPMAGSGKRSCQTWFLGSCQAWDTAFVAEIHSLSVDFHDMPQSMAFVPAFR